MILFCDAFTFQELLAILAPAAAASRLQAGVAGGRAGGQIRCLRCHQISPVMTPQEELDVQGKWTSKTGRGPGHSSLLSVLSA